MAYRYDDLIGRIIAKFGSRKAFADAMHMTAESLSQKLNGKRYFNQKQITRACELLEIAEADVVKYFFTLKVQSA
jgi:hypothetical protein